MGLQRIAAASSRVAMEIRAASSSSIIAITVFSNMHSLSNENLFARMKILWIVWRLNLSR